VRLPLADGLKPVSVHPLKMRLLFPESGKIKTGRSEKDEDNRNEQ
jgi:hypothetical protein